MSGNLFEAAAKKLLRQSAPLADRMRPKSFDEFCGQEHLIGPGMALRHAIESDSITSSILWGPPGSGKTTLAYVIAQMTRAHFVSFSAVVSGIKEAREVIAQAADQLVLQQKRTILFVDEIHRFNKAQQDAFLPHVEKGTILLIGATTENPSFEINAALLSRCRVFVLHQLSDQDLEKILSRALADRDNGFRAESLEAEPDAIRLLARSAGGDARTALSNLEWVVACLSEGAAPRTLTKEHVARALPHKALLYDARGEEHFNLLSALHKSVRGSDPQGALYWLARMITSGEDPMVLARRMVRMAVEDIGLADPQALPVAIAARDAYHFLGTPEGELALAELAIYLATAPKSNRAYVAWDQAKQAAVENGPLPVPLHLRNAPTTLMKELGYGKDYQYAFDHEGAYVAQDYLPESLRDAAFYEPGSLGFEREIHQRLEWWEKQRREKDAGEEPR